MGRPLLSIAIPVYNEDGNLETLFTRLKTVLDDIDKSYEIIFTNDGSNDNSLTLLRHFQKCNPGTVRIIDLNGNFGQHMAVMAAFEQVRGEIIVTLDADLQNPPEEIPKLISAIEKGHDLVGSYRKRREDNLFRCIASRLFNFLRDLATGIHMRDQGCMLRAYRRRIVDIIVASGERSTFIPALAMSYATNPVEVEVDHEARLTGKSRYRIYDLIRLNFDIMTGFSMAPLQLVTMFGMLVASGSLLFVVYLFIRRLIIGPEAEGVFTLFAILYLLIGIGIFCLGVIGEYIGRIYQEVRHRPRFVIREVIETGCTATENGDE
ncbi:MAG: UDP-4-amino-4-deoxy-L-arabinose-oxoglutarate aminotransferase [marine bacterium B5-7]|nr:MAG: UDP-4-amino-4-deoxy-L-arabinose-oxoglutarate aminotransferase [marine bacterium B5-7]